MKITLEQRWEIFDKTMGRCHLCRKTLCINNYGLHGRRGAWEIDHSRPRARGGSNHGNNLLPACTRCNRSKGKNSTKSARAGNGYRAAPHSKKRKVRNAWATGALGSTAALFVPPQYRLLVAIAGGLAGAVAGYKKEPD